MQASHAPDSQPSDPRHRPIEPDHPMMVDGGVLRGNTELMFRCMVEEYLQAGHDIDMILSMCRDPNYQGFHAAMQTLGTDHATQLARNAAARVGIHRVTEYESPMTATPTALTIGQSSGTTSERKGPNHA